MRPRRERALPIRFSWPQTPALSRWVQAYWDLGGPVRCNLWQSGLNLTYRVQGPRSAYFLRLSRPSHPLPQIRFEVAQLRFLQSRGIVVGAPLASRRGALIVPVPLAEGLGQAVLFSEAPGGRWDSPRKAVAASFGASLARLHLAQGAFRARPILPAIDEVALVDVPLTHLERHRASFGSRWRDLVAMAKDLRKSLAPLSRSAPAFGLIHADPHAGNLRYDPKRRDWGYFDFELTRHGWRLFDLATHLWGRGWQGPALREGARSLLKAYSGIRPLERSELNALPAMMAARHFWWMGFQAMAAEDYEGVMASSDSHQQKMRFLDRWAKGGLAKELGQP